MYQCIVYIAGDSQHTFSELRCCLCPTSGIIRSSFWWTIDFIAVSGALQLMSCHYKSWFLQEIHSLYVFNVSKTTANWFNHSTMFRHCLEWKAKAPKIQFTTENSSPGYPVRREMNLNLFYWDVYGDVFPPTPPTPRTSTALSSRILGPRCRGSLRRGETKGARVCLTFHTWKDQHPKRKGASSNYQFSGASC